MTWQSLVAPRRWARDLAGRCLPYAQTFFGAPIMHDYARQAWDATEYKHHDRDFPDVPCLLWFDHWGTYYSHSKGVWEYVNAGHVTPLVPGEGIYSSPTWGHGYALYQTIAAVEAAYNCRYIGWSEDLNGLRVIQPTPEEEKDPMPLIEALPTHKSRQVAKPGQWTTVKLTPAGGVTLLRSRDRALDGTVHTTIHASGEFQARYVYDDVRGKTITKRSPSVVSRYDREGIHAYPVYLPAGGDRRLRLQIKPTGTKPLTILAVAGQARYWEAE